MADTSPFPIKFSKIATPKPRFVPLKTIQTKAGGTGHQHAGMDLGGATIPYIDVDLSAIKFEKGASGDANAGSVRYEKGHVFIEIFQEMYLNKSLSKCERGIWRRHELDHVADIKKLPNLMLDALQIYGKLDDFFVERVWIPGNKRDAALADIKDLCIRVFLGLVSEAVWKRDTPAEYRRVLKRIKGKCGGINKPARKGSTSHDRRIKNKSIK